MELIYFDACLLIYLVESHAVFGPPLTAAIEAVVGEHLVISPLVKLECLVGSIKRADTVLQRRYESIFERFATVEMPDAVYRQAAVLRARFGLRTPDALHLACAQHHRCTALWTNDDRLVRAGHGIARNVVA